MSWALLATRIALSEVFDLAGLAKLLDLKGSRKAITDFGLPLWAGKLIFHQDPPDLVLLRLQEAVHCQCWIGDGHRTNSRQAMQMWKAINACRTLPPKEIG